MNRKFLLAICAIVVHCAMAQSVVPWLTRSHDNQRTGWNNQETVLTQASIETKGISIKEIVPVSGDARGLEAQPLIVPNVKTVKGTHDLMLLPSMANVVRAVDFHDGSDVWDVTLGTPVVDSEAIDFHQINQYWGALSTGVVDVSTNRYYQVYWSSPDGSRSAQTAKYFMAVLNLSDGSPVVPAVEIMGVTPTGEDFNSAMRKARSSATLLVQGPVHTILQCTGTVQETTNGASGFCFAFDTLTNGITAMISTTQGKGAGIWNAGQGLTCAPDGSYCYTVTGNGDFDGLTQWGESFIQLKYVPPTSTTKASFSIIKGWSPWTDLQRSGQAQVPAGKLAGDSLPSEAVKPVGGGMAMSLVNAKLVANQTSTGVPNILVYPNMATGTDADQDWGSSQAGCIYPIGKCIAIGKDGIGYVLSIPDFVGTTATDVGTKANCAKLASPPIWATVDPGPVDPCPTDPKTLNFFPNGYTAHLHATPVQFLNPISNTYEIAAGGENQQVHIWDISNSGVPNYLGEGNEYASSDLRGKPPGGMTGSMCAGSSNGIQVNTYLLYCIQPYGDSNAAVVPGHLIIYDPIHIVNGVMPTLWDSANYGAHDPKSRWYCMMNKFLPPAVDGGEVIYPCYDGRVMILSQ